MPRTTFECRINIVTDGEIESIDVIHANDLMHLMSQFTIALLTIQKKSYEKEVRELKYGKDDDIPF